MYNYFYSGTITFEPCYSLRQKEKLINRFISQLGFYLHYRSNARCSIELIKEYHKTDGQDDPERPHYHFVLSATHLVSKLRFRAIRKWMKEDFGICQFGLLTTMGLRKWQSYINKDVSKNEALYGLPHRVVQDIVVREADDLLSLEYLDE